MNHDGGRPPSRRARVRHLRSPLGRDAADELSSVEQAPPTGHSPRLRMRMSDVAVVHDYLNQRGGAERVALELARLYPEAPIYTSLYRAGSTFPEFAERDVRQSYVGRLPIDHGFRNLFPLYPSAFRSFGVLDQRLVLTSSSGWAHGVRTALGATHIVYCHTPARWLYAPEAYLGAASWQQRAARPIMGAIRRWDRSAAS